MTVIGNLPGSSPPCRGARFGVRHGARSRTPVSTGVVLRGTT